MKKRAESCFIVRKLQFPKCFFFVAHHIFLCLFTFNTMTTYKIANESFMYVFHGVFVCRINKIYLCEKKWERERDRSRTICRYLSFPCFPHVTRLFLSFSSSSSLTISTRLALLIGVCLCGKCIIWQHSLHNFIFIIIHSNFSLFSHHSRCCALRNSYHHRMTLRALHHEWENLYEMHFPHLIYYIYITTE